MKKIINKICIVLFISATLYAQGKPGKVNLRTFSDNTQFENANQFYKLEKYGKALDLFKEYLEIYPKGLHRKDALKIIGSIYYNQYDYLRAVKTYKSIYEEYNNTDEGIEAFFMTGICYQKMGFTDRAAEVFNLIINEYPGSGFAYQSKIKLDLINLLKDG